VLIEELINLIELIITDKKVSKDKRQRLITVILDNSNSPKVILEKVESINLPQLIIILIGNIV
tara:strand:- start:16037 stop:16225 length:189 start_codon:yes stop_codon:yes gene_type:complete